MEGFHARLHGHFIWGAMSYPCMLTSLDIHAVNLVSFKYVGEHENYVARTLYLGCHICVISMS